MRVPELLDFLGLSLWSPNSRARRGSYSPRRFTDTVVLSCYQNYMYHIIITSFQPPNRTSPPNFPPSYVAQVQQSINNAFICRGRTHASCNSTTTAVKRPAHRVRTFTASGPALSKQTFTNTAAVTGHGYHRTREKTKEQEAPVR
jgi:hypothetical protein